MGKLLHCQVSFPELKQNDKKLYVLLLSTISLFIDCDIETRNEMHEGETDQGSEYSPE